MKGWRDVEISVTPEVERALECFARHVVLVGLSWGLVVGGVLGLLIGHTLGAR